MDCSKLKINQGFLFHLYNWILPLMIPSLAILILGVYLNANWVILLMTLITQLSFYNVVILSTNIGLLISDKKKDAFKNHNTGYSIILLIIAMFIFSLSLIVGFTSDKDTDLKNIYILTFIFCIIFSYFSVLLLSKNNKSSFRKNTVELSNDRAKVNKESYDSILGGVKNE